MARSALHRRRRHRGRKRFGAGRAAHVLRVFVLVAAVGAFVYGFLRFVWDSGRFQVNTVLIEGTNILDDQVVLEASGITGADSVWFLDTQGVVARVEAMPYVKSCSIEVIFPDTVTLRVEERVALATLMVNSRSYELDREGIVLREYAPSEMPGVPFITNVAGVEFVRVGDQLSQPALAVALAIWDAFSQTSMAQDVAVSELSAPGEDDVRMYCDNLPYELRWGRGGFERQAKRLDILWREKGGELHCQEYLDLRFNEKLVCR